MTKTKKLRPRDVPLPKWHFCVGLGNWHRTYITEARSYDEAHSQAMSLAMREAPFLDWPGEYLTYAFHGMLKH